MYRPRLSRASSNHLAFLSWPLFSLHTSLKYSFAGNLSGREGGRLADLTMLEIIWAGTSIAPLCPAETTKYA